MSSNYEIVQALIRDDLEEAFPKKEFTIEYSKDTGDYLIRELFKFDLKIPYSEFVKENEVADVIAKYNREATEAVLRAAGEFTGC